MSKYRVGLVQFEPIPEDISGNAEKASELVLKAISNRADIIVLPELSNSGYLFENKRHAFSLAESLENAKSINYWIKLAVQHNVYIVAGINERFGDDNFNSAVVVGPEGMIGVYRKIHLWDLENLFFTKGNEFPPIFELPFAKVGLQICYDLWFPEMSRKQALMGAELICVPTNWSPTPDGSAYDANGLFVGHHLMISHASVNHMSFACTNRIGSEKNLVFLGGSCVINSSGHIIDDICSRDNEEVKVVEVSNYKGKRGFLHDRREAFYEI
jgi:predicted amidohydrolase